MENPSFGANNQGRSQYKGNPAQPSTQAAVVPQQSQSLAGMDGTSMAHNHRATQ